MPLVYLIRTQARPAPGFSPWKYWRESAGEWTRNKRMATVYRTEDDARARIRKMRAGSHPVQYRKPKKDTIANAFGKAREDE